MIVSENRSPPIGSKPEGKLFRIMLWRGNSRLPARGLAPLGSPLCVRQQTLWPKSINPAANGHIANLLRPKSAAHTNDASGDAG